MGWCLEAGNPPTPSLDGAHSGRKHCKRESGHQLWVLVTTSDWKCSGQQVMIHFSFLSFKRSPRCTHGNLKNQGPGWKTWLSTAFKVLEFHRNQIQGSEDLETRCRAYLHCLLRQKGVAFFFDNTKNVSVCDHYYLSFW